MDLNLVNLDSSDVSHAPSIPLGRHYHRVVLRQTAATAGRTVLAGLWEKPNGLLVPRVIPVAAISTVTFQIWETADPDLPQPVKLPYRNDVAPPPPPPGWVHTRTISNSRLVVARKDGRLVTLNPDEEPLRGRVLECPWPPEEDDERLAPLMEELREDALRLDEDEDEDED
jgi:hypothetical protein